MVQKAGDVVPFIFSSRCSPRCPRRSRSRWSPGDAVRGQRVHLDLERDPGQRRAVRGLDPRRLLPAGHDRAARHLRAVLQRVPQLLRREHRLRDLGRRGGPDHDRGGPGGLPGHHDHGQGDHHLHGVRVGGAARPGRHDLREGRLHGPHQHRPVQPGDRGRRRRGDLRRADLRDPVQRGLRRHPHAGRGDQDAEEVHPAGHDRRRGHGGDLLDRGVLGVLAGRPGRRDRQPAQPGFHAHRPDRQARTGTRATSSSSFPR